MDDGYAHCFGKGRSTFAFRRSEPAYEPMPGQDYLCSHPAHEGICGEFVENFGALHEISIVKLRSTPLARVSQQSTWFRAKVVATC